MNGGNGYYPFPIRQGSKRDFVGAWFMRLLLALLTAGILYTSKLILAGVMYLVNTLPPMQVNVNELKVDVAALKTDVANLKRAAVTKQELEAVKNELTEQLKQRSKRVAQ